MYSLLQRMNSGVSRSKVSVESESISALQLDDWTKALQNTKIERNEMNKLVMNYLIVEGYKEAAEKFCMETGVEPSEPLSSLDDRIVIKEAVQNGSIDEAVNLINDVDPNILDCNPQLYFHLQQQKLIEFIRMKNIEKALEFSQNILAELCAENVEFLGEFEKTMALLAFENPEISLFGDLLSREHKQMLASEVNVAILNSKHQETMPNLAKAMKLCLWTQNELDKKHVKYPKMNDLASGVVKSLAEDKITTITIA